MTGGTTNTTGDLCFQIKPDKSARAYGGFTATTGTFSGALSTTSYAQNTLRGQTNFYPDADSGLEINNQGGNATGVVAKTGDALYLGANGTAGAIHVNNSNQVSFPQNATFAGTVTCSTIDTGQGANALYDMNQNVKDDSTVQFSSLGVGRAGSGTDGECVIEKGLYVGNGSASYGQDEVRAEGEVTAYYGSDIAMKKNLTPISNPLDKVLSLSGYDFKWKAKVLKDRGGEDGYFVREKDVGIIAQEVEKVCPEIVATRRDGNKAVRYEKLVPLLIESIKELTAKVRRLENGNT